MPLKEPTAYHIAQLRKGARRLQRGGAREALVVRLLVDSGMRRAEVCGLAVKGPDGLGLRRGVSGWLTHAARPSVS